MPFISLKNINDEFTAETVAEVRSAVPLSHKVSRGKLQGSDKVWIKKEIKHPYLAKKELLAQEFFRLIIPHQPETRLLYNSVTRCTLYTFRRGCRL